MGAFNYQSSPFSLFHLPLFRRMPLVFLVIVMPVLRRLDPHRQAIIGSHRCYSARSFATSPTLHQPTAATTPAFVHPPPLLCAAIWMHFDGFIISACPFDTRDPRPALVKPVISLSSLFIGESKIIPSSGQGHSPLSSLSLILTVSPSLLALRSPCILALLIG